MRRGPSTQKLLSTCLKKTSFSVNFAVRYLFIYDFFPDHLDVTDIFFIYIFLLFLLYLYALGIYIRPHYCCDNNMYNNKFKLLLRLRALPGVHKCRLAYVERNHGYLCEIARSTIRAVNTSVSVANLSAFVILLNTQLSTWKVISLFDPPNIAELTFAKYFSSERVPYARIFTFFYLYIARQLVTRYGIREYRITVPRGAMYIFNRINSRLIF